MSRTTKISVGSIQVSALRDGELYLPKEALVNLREEDAATINNSENSALIYGNVNAYLIQSANRNLLIDAECRELFGPTCGFLQDAIKETGLELRDITDLFFTHLHPDHIAGAISTDGMAVFENAALQVLESEHNFWTTNNFDPIEVNGADWANLARGVLSAYNDKKEIISFTKDLIPGVSLLSIPGHTPGHSGFRVDSDNQALVHLGDIIHAPNLQLNDPNASTIFDIDGGEALNSRKKMLDMVSTDRVMCTSGHTLEPKFGFIEKHGTGFKFTA